MQKFYKIRNFAALILIFNLSFAAMCGSKKESRERILIKATDDFAEGQKSVARILANSKQSGLISQEDINEVKPFLLQANDLNAQAIELGKKLIENPVDTVIKDQLVNTINLISAVLVRANSVGLFRIKDANTRAAFSEAILLLQATVTGVAILLKN